MPIEHAGADATLVTCVVLGDRFAAKLLDPALARVSPFILLLYLDALAEYEPGHHRDTSCPVYPRGLALRTDSGVSLYLSELGAAITMQV